MGKESGDGRKERGGDGGGGLKLLSYEGGLVVLLVCVALAAVLRSDYSPLPAAMEAAMRLQEALLGEETERHWRHSLSLLSECVGESERRDLERLRFDDTVAHSFPGSLPLQSLEWKRGTYSVEAVTDAALPLLIKGTPAERWEALKRWNDSTGRRLEIGGFTSVDVHCPSLPEVRLHSPDAEAQPLGRHGVDSLGVGDRMWAAAAAAVAEDARDIPLVTWKRQPWLEAEVPVHWFWKYAGQRLLYVMAKVDDLPPAVREDIGSLSYAKLPWSPPLETNVWMGTPQVSTPAHYDMVHNFYTQVVGKKRWIIIPPDQAESLHLYPAIHPSDRMSQVDFNSRDSLANWQDMEGVTAYEVVLEAGDVLYVPPFHFHHVTVVGDGPSVSVSTHSEAHQSWLRERIMAKTERMLAKLATKSSRAWDLHSGARALWHYFSSVIACHHDPQDFVRRLIESRWKPLQQDRDVDGLWDLLEAVPRFVVADIQAVELSEVELDILGKNAAEIADVFRVLTPLTGRDIMLGNHVEFFSNMLLGDLYVLPFLEACQFLSPSPPALSES
mmetsp:Transcript_1678/g.5972  ORF Transcript_1678/g.5972 Transcript_1678/m.5972 type:complete len:556 (-) Transcript_1678:27-1694(-)